MRPRDPLLGKPSDIGGAPIVEVLEYWKIPLGRSARETFGVRRNFCYGINNNKYPRWWLHIWI